MECAFTSPGRTERGIFVMCCIQCCSSVSTDFVVRGCVVSWRYINVCNSDVFSDVNMYLDQLKLCVVCSNGRRYVCCSECYVVYNECHEPTPCLVQPIGAHGGEVLYFWSFRGELGFLNCDDICMCVL